jgi:AraC-like DNA-binding protein
VKRQQDSPDFFSAQVSEARRFYLDLDPPRSRRLAVVCGGLETCTADYEIRRAGFPYDSVEFVFRGKGALILGGRRHSLEAGCVFSYGPRVAHHITTDPLDPMVKYFVDFVGGEATSLLRRAGLRPGTLVETSAPGDISGLFDDMIRSGLRDSRFGPAICAAILEHLLLRLAETSVPTGTVGTPALATYERCRRHMEEHHLRLRVLGDIARECRVDPAYLCRLFRRFAHQSPYRFLLRLKMNRAAERLAEPGILVKEVAGELGFSDPYHFSRAFKRVYGVSPRRFTRLGQRS